VRYIGNRSSGIQGIAIAQAALSRGAEVTLVAANVTELLPASINTIRVESAAEMLAVLSDEFVHCDYLFMAAAVADARPAQLSETKIKKSNFQRIELVENPDILATVSASKSQQVVIAFAAETVDGAIETARSKMEKKRADIIYLNNVSGGEIFGGQWTSGQILDSSGEVLELPRVSKSALAHQLINSALTVGNKLG
jgi:phosphopantothenoylcysteine decarboxylase/phosphopantothenate--cysteine ligase